MSAPAAALERRADATPGGSPPGRAPSAPRADIQGLRALAVAAVLAYHVWPSAVPGGYVGVDVFFVLSGFLITSHLVRRPLRTAGDLLEFWARRVRRLVPAASLVLLVTLVAAVVWLPATVRADVGREALAAVLYVENWALARSATDYLAADELHTPVQHYWSLSVEEQFYLVWPVALAVAGWLLVRGSRALRRRAPADRERARDAAVAALVVAALVVATSLAWSVHLTATDPAAAYFVSTTRAWELGLGGLLAAIVALRPVRPGPAGRAVLAWTGLLLVGVAVATFDARTPFPGWTALVPTVGTALVVAAAADGVAAGPGSVLGRRAVRWLGDVSYSVYLWHWPVVVVAPFVLGRPPGLAEQLAAVALTLVLAALTKRFVEDPVRRDRRLARRKVSTFGLLALATLVVGAAALVVVDRATAAEHEAADVVAHRLAAAGPCAGAGAVRDPSCTVGSLLTPPEFAAEDKPAPYADGCWNNAPFTTRHTCTYSGTDRSEQPSARVALVGNSHAGHWLPALEDVVAEDGWQLTTYLQSVCYPVDRPLAFDDAEETEGCLGTNRWAVRSVVEGGYDLVVMSARTNQSLAGVAQRDQAAAAQEAYAETLEAFTAAGIPVLVLRDTPAMPGDVPDCVASRPDDVAACGAPRSTALEPDPLAAAASDDDTGLVRLVEVTDLMCDARRCHAVVGGVVAYFDHGHLTATFARTLAPEVAAGARAALAGAG
ncbi:acyltransferase family protein [Isoptericola variabilis]|uniref:Acyltransferase 3 n=2 Tax=Isoptericola TaxID=254250 RepID=F6FRN3_ISOV2|nr:acyltransferase family protein [Isoptericola variabilis]AEG45091.1 acyltransferase 3 [Isoptericola variabilis 225]